MTHDPALPRHFGCIDAMRGIAALFVTIYHATRFFVEDATTYVVPVTVYDMPYGSWLWPAYLYGEDAVRLFWVISGFVFAHVYWTRPTNAREFAVARFARLYPLHFVTLILVAGMQMISLQTQGYWQITGNNDLKHFVLHLFMLDTSLNLSDGVSFNAPIWSVSAELFIYVVFFFTLSLTKRNPLGGSLLLAALSYILLVQAPDGFIIGHWVFACGVFFFAGGACYAVFRALNGDARLWGVIGCLAIGAGVAAGAGHHDAVLLAGCCAIVMALAAAERHLPRRSATLQFLGDISYSLYLVHMPLQIAAVLVIDLWLGGGRAFAQSYLTLPVFLAVSIWVAYLVHQHFERPVGAWLRLRLMKADRAAVTRRAHV
ncbi:acyltransferase family protein [Pseudooctadecabacter sp.]|uniref:acyltransferase family protein n=1 Tax=Pseudooctadecabacter sp. TaxID=1966338 RepID=UPI0025EF605B|nr:acyltransferase [Pseudooctadecabacter sp.]